MRITKVTLYPKLRNIIFQEYSSNCATQKNPKSPLMKEKCFLKGKLVIILYKKRVKRPSNPLLSFND
jgi:hypothetical protein